MVRAHAALVAARARQKKREFGLGAWLPATVMAELAEDGPKRDEVQRELRARHMEVWTWNAFPMGGFHDEVVKTSVYEPDWGTEERVQFTWHCGKVAAALAAPGAILPISTLPLGYRAPGMEPADLRLMARNLVRCASGFRAIEEKTGIRCVLALEPEPYCLLETSGQAAEFFERWVFEPGAWPTVPEAVRRRHLGLCLDLCHMAVVGEDPLASLRHLDRQGIEIPKIQISTCLEARSPAGVVELLEFDEPRYLHQTFARGVRALDLDDVSRRVQEFAAAGLVRTHFHMPIFWDADGPLGSTRSELERVLPALRNRAQDTVYEVETYTWSVLNDFAGNEPLAERIARELDFAANLLGL
jgi:sugar phosphate isomerase/epimerase